MTSYGPSGHPYTQLYPDFWTLAGFRGDHFEHVRSEIHQKLHPSVGLADVVEEQLVAGGQAVPQPVLRLQDGGQIPPPSVQEPQGQLGHAPVVHPEVLAQLGQEPQPVLLAQPPVVVHEVHAAGLWRRRGLVSGLVCGQRCEDPGQYLIHGREAPSSSWGRVPASKAHLRDSEGCFEDRPVADVCNREQKRVFYHDGEGTELLPPPPNELR